MKTMNKILSIVFLGAITLTLVACGSLQDDDILWNRRRDAAADNHGTAMNFTPGVFEGVGTGGYYGNVYVTVTISEAGEIVDIQVEHKETPTFGGEALTSTLIPNVLKYQTYEIDAFTNATLTSNAFFMAMEDALGNARAGSANVTSGSGMTFDPGTYQGVSTVRGFGGHMTVEVVVGADGSIASITVVEHSESNDWYNMAVPVITDNILTTGLIDVDGVTNATYTSNSFLSAIAEALADANGVLNTGAPSAVGGNFTPGTFVGVSTVRGFGGHITVEVVIGANGAIEGIEVTNHSESSDWYNMAVPTITENMISAGTYEVDGVAHATYTSNSFIDAVREALTNAQ